MILVSLKLNQDIPVLIIIAHVWYEKYNGRSRNKFQEKFNISLEQTLVHGLSNIIAN